MNDDSNSPQAPVEAQPSVTEIAAVLNLPNGRPALDAAVSVKVNKDDLKFAELIARRDGHFNQAGEPTVVPMLREALEKIAAEGRRLYEEGHQLLQNTGS